MKTGRVKTVIFDWAGTTVDYGCFAPLKVFLEIFRRRGIEVTIAEARGPMGRMKRDHIRAMCEAPVELEIEGGISARFARYSQNQRILAEGMARMGFEIIDFGERQSPIISTFKSPSSPDYDFVRFYDELAMRGFVIYPGKTTKANTFRIGTIGELYSGDIQRLLRAVGEVKFW